MVVPTTEEIATPAGRELPVDVMRVEPITNYVRKRDYLGKVVSRRTSELAFKLAGSVFSITVDEGQVVKEGDVLARLDDRSLQAELKQIEAQLKQATAQLEMLVAGPRSEVILAAQADVARIEATLELQSRILERRVKLLRSNAASREDVDQTQFTRRATKAQLAAARAKLDELKAGTRREEIESQRAVRDRFLAAREAVNVQLADSILTAPFSGSISKRYVDEGIVVDGRHPILRLVETQHLEAQVGVPAHLANKLEVGSTHNINCSSIRQTVSGHLRSVLPEVDSATQTRMAIFDIQSSEDAPAIGEIVRVELSQTIRASGFWIPATAIEQSQRGLWSAYVARTVDGQLVSSRQDVEVIVAEEERVLVRGTIRPGDQIVTGGLHRLAQSQPISIRRNEDLVAGLNEPGERREK